MNSIEKKLKKFEEDCYKLANQNRDELEEKVNLKISKAIQDEINEYRNKLAKKKKNTLTKMEKDFNSELWEIENECKKRLIEEEKKMKEELFLDVCNQMKQYVDNAEYEEFFINNILVAVNNLGSTENLVVSVTRKDKDRFLDKIMDFSENIEIIDDSYIGGCIVKNNSEIINNTILMNLKERIHE